jgi:nicotinamide mononucleotide adenylyltransferase
MKNRAIILFFLLLPSSCSFAQKDTCMLGIYINSLYDFKLEDKSFMTDFWIWQTYKNDSLNFENVAEIINSKTADFSHYSHEKKAGVNWVSQKCKAQMMQEWDVTKFPFDKQVLRIEIEDSKYNSSQVIYCVDHDNSRIDNSFNSKEWSLEQFSLSADEHTYQTTYGDPELSGTSSYPRVVAEIKITRNNSWRMLIKMLTGAYVAFMISCLVFFVSSKNQDSRFGLCVGGLFAAIGNKYIVESVVPSTSASTLMDNVHSITFTFILIIVCISIISLKLFESDNERKNRFSLKLDKWSFFSVVIIYAIINTCIIYMACR